MLAEERRKVRGLLKAQAVGDETNGPIGVRQFIVQAGDVCFYESFVVRACLRAYYTDANGFEHNVQFAVKNWWIADLASFITQAPATLDVEALEDCELLQFD